MAVAALLSSDAASRRRRRRYRYCAPVFCRMHAGLGCLPSSARRYFLSSSLQKNKKKIAQARRRCLKAKPSIFTQFWKGKKQQFLKISVQPQSARRLQAILFCGRHGFLPATPPAFHLSSSASRITLWNFRMAVGMRAYFRGSVLADNCC